MFARLVEERAPRLRLPGPWLVSAVLIASVVALPIVTVTSFVLQPATEVWRHLYETVLADYVTNSLLLMLGVAAGTLAMGVCAAWLVSMCEFPGRRAFEWALLLPLAMPAYIIAYTYTGMLDFAGPVQSALRAWFGWGFGDYWFPEIRSLPGAVAMLSLVLYPYVYLLSRAAFVEQSVCVLEVSRTLGCGPWRSFAVVGIPLARPAIIAGLSLALMETLADYGTVEYFGIPTFTTGIFRTWFGLGDASAAAQLSAVLLGFVFALLLLERWSRHRARFHHTTSRYRRLPVNRLRGWRAALATVACLVPVTFGFAVPALQLAWWAQQTWRETLDGDFLLLAWHSFELAGLASLLALALAMALAYGQRVQGGRALAALARFAGMGYAIPGTVIAVGVLIPFGWLDNSVDEWMRRRFDLSTGLVFSGTLFLLLFAYCVRFLAVSLQAVEAGLGKVKPTMDDAARSLGLRPSSVLREVHLPMLRGTLLSAALLVFVDVLKELPATYILRPFNFNTLAVRAFELASDERLADSASAALAIVVVGIVPVVLLSRMAGRSRPGDATHTPEPDR